MNNIIQKLKKAPIIPVLTFDDETIALNVSEALIKGGLTNLEVTLRTKEAFQCIEIIKKEFKKDVLLGAGTVLEKKHFKKIKKIGVDFAVSPGFTKSLIKEARKEKIPYLPAASTPSEVMQLFSLGITFQKFFHANNSGGYKMLQTFKFLFPQVNFCPTGGINSKDFQEYLRLQNVLCLGGSWLVTKEDMENKNYKAIEQRAKDICEILEK